MCISQDYFFLIQIFLITDIDHVTRTCSDVVPPSLKYHSAQTTCLSNLSHHHRHLARKFDPHSPERKFGESRQVIVSPTILFRDRRLLSFLAKIHR
jgi:hypothetical protein